MPQDDKEAAERRAKLLTVSLRSFLCRWAAITGQRAAGSSNSSGAAAAPAKVAAKQPASKPGGKAKADPKGDCCAVLLTELDERISKAKRCTLDDLYAAVGGLEAHEQHALAAITAVSSASFLPAKGGSEATLAIRDALCAAAAAHTLHTQPSWRQPEASKSCAGSYRERGLPVTAVMEAGFTAGQALSAGFSTADVVAQSGPSLRHLRAAGISVAELFEHLSEAAAADLSGVAGAARLRAAGYTAAAVTAGAAHCISDWDLRLAGYELPPGLGDAASATDYFRTRVAPLMQMRPERDVSPLLVLGTRAAARGAAESGRGGGGAVAAAVPVVNRRLAAGAGSSSSSSSVVREPSSRFAHGSAG